MRQLDLCVDSNPGRVDLSSARDSGVATLNLQDAGSR